MTQATIDQTQTHNNSSAGMAEAVALGIRSTQRHMAEVESLRRALAEAIPEEPWERHDPEKVRKLAHETLQT